MNFQIPEKSGRDLGVSVSILNSLQNKATIEFLEMSVREVGIDLECFNNTCTLTHKTAEGKLLAQGTLCR
jgi:hypothetical protein